MKVSNSEIQTFKECRRAWWLKYVRGLTPKTDKLYGAREIGNYVHDALEDYYRSLLSPDPFDVDAILTRISVAGAEHIEAAPEQEPHIVKDVELAEIMVAGYFEWLEEEGADIDLEVVAPEAEVEVPLGTIRGVDVSIIGKLDLRVIRRRDGAKLWLDHKTVQSLGEYDTLGPLNEQFKLYSWLEWMLSEGEDWADGGIINMLRKVKRTVAAKPPFYGRKPLRYNEDVMRDMTQRTRRVVEEMISLRDALAEGGRPGTLVYPRPSRDCSWKCEFLAVCPMFDDGSDVESIIGEVYEEHDPYERYVVTEH